MQQPSESTNQRINLLQAQGLLNKHIQSALQQFRKSLTSTISICPQSQSPLSISQSLKQGPQKQFQFRESLLSLMFKIKDFKTLYNMVTASFIILTFTLLFSNYNQKAQLIEHDELGLMFEGVIKVIVYWIAMVVIHFSIILIVKVGIKTKKYVWMPLYVMHGALLLATAIYCSKHQKLGFASIMIVMAEATRMIMKSHSYFRTKMLYLTDNQYKDFTLKGYRATNNKKNIPLINIKKTDEKSLKNNNQSTIQYNLIEIEDNNIFTQVKNLSYFFLAPTIIYRDRYTLTPIRSMSKIIINALNFMACIYYSFLLYIFICKPAIQKLQQKLDFSTYLMTVIKLMLPSTFFLILGFFGFLHSWLNCWAQITRFPDRGFYLDWWNSIQFGSYYRKWNIIVHDWLYYFVYLDICRFFKCNQRSFMPKLMTFLISAVIHQLIITYALGFFYPILFILFTGPGIILIQNTKNLKSISVNLAFWLEMYIGGSLLFTTYLIESFARKRILDQFIYQEWGNIGYFIPRTFYLGEVVV